MKNFHSVAAGLYRSGQLTLSELRQLKGEGLVSIINLRMEGAIEEERVLAAEVGLAYMTIPIKDGGLPSEKQAKKLLRLMQEESLKPLLVHCKEGEGRTGVVIAMYRIAVEGWSNDDALKEARSLGLSWWAFKQKSFIKNFRKES